MLRKIRAYVTGLHLLQVALRSLGIVVAASGFAHFVAPARFRAISAPIFPEDTAKWVKVNGSSEAAIGVALIDRRTRVAGVVGGLVYGVYLSDRIGTAVLHVVRGTRPTSRLT